MTDQKDGSAQGTAFQEALQDCKTHRDAWRGALLRQQTPFGSDDDGSYWAHELRAFDRTFAALTAALTPAASERQWCTACGTVSSDRVCDCNRYGQDRQPQFVNYADAMQEEARQAVQEAAKTCNSYLERALRAEAQVERAREEIVLAIAFLGRDAGTSRLDITANSLIARLVKVDAEIRAAPNPSTEQPPAAWLEAKKEVDEGWPDRSSDAPQVLRGEDGR